MEYFQYKKFSSTTVQSKQMGNWQFIHCDLWQSWALPVFFNFFTIEK